MKNNNISNPIKPKIVHVRCWYSPISKFSTIFKHHHYYNQWFTYLCWDGENKKYYWGTKEDLNMISWDDELRANDFIKVMYHSSLYDVNNPDFTYFNYDFKNQNLTNKTSEI